MDVSVKQKLGFGAFLFGALYVLFDALLEMLFELLHLAFEAAEFTLDVIIEHLFDTGRHATQTITFYILLLLAAYVLYKLSRRLRGWYEGLRTDLTETRCQMTETVLTYWHTSSAFRRVKWCSALTIGISLLMWGLLS
ncbi:MAG: hypothetical protein ACU83V_10670 [Gammaproteobacteria bacterium]